VSLPFTVAMTTHDHTMSTITVFFPITNTIALTVVVPRHKIPLLEPSRAYRVIENFLLMARKR
jgi:hypothetical protein